MSREAHEFWRDPVVTGNDTGGGGGGGGGTIKLLDMGSS